MMAGNSINTQRKAKQHPFLLLVIFLISLSSCDLFTTRTPDSPDLGATFIWTPASTPGYLLDNFKGTLIVLDAANYTKCFIGTKDSSVTGEKLSYVFVPRPGLDAATRSIFDGWNVQSEQNFLTKLRSSLVSQPRLTVTLSNITINQLNTNAADISVDYDVLLPIPVNSTLPASITGSIIFHVALVTTEEETKEWRIITWSDFAQTSGNAKTFTDLKSQVN